MTKTQIIHLLNKLDINPNIITHLPGVNYIAIDKGGNIIKVDYASIRFNFNTNKDYMEVIFCRPYSRDILEVPAHGHYDVLNDKYGNQTVFEYLVDTDNNVIKDYYIFEAIDLFSLNMPYVETFAIRWFNWDNTLLQLDDEALGVTPIYTGVTPTRPDSSTHSFTFDSWSPAPNPATSNQDYVAVFDAIPLEGVGG